MAAIGIFTSVLLFCIGLYAVMVNRNLFKMVIGLMIMEGGVLLLLVAAAYIPGGASPILSPPFSGPDNRGVEAGAQSIGEGAMTEAAAEQDQIQNNPQKVYQGNGNLIKAMVDPVPQAITLTAIVIGACEIALLLALISRLHSFYKTLDVDKIKGLKG